MRLKKFLNVEITINGVDGYAFKGAGFEGFTFFGTVLFHTDASVLY